MNLKYIQRKGVLKKTIDGKKLKRRKKSTINEIRKNKRNKNLKKKRRVVRMIATTKYRFSDDSIIIAQKVWKFSIKFRTSKIKYSLLQLVACF